MKTISLAFALLAGCSASADAPPDAGPAQCPDQASTPDGAAATFVIALPGGCEVRPTAPGLHCVVSCGPEVLAAYGVDSVSLCCGGGDR
jgi:hypothetical protein